MQIKEKSDDPATVIQIRQLLHPFEYTKVDKIIDVIFTTAVDVGSQQEEEKEKPESRKTASTNQSRAILPCLLNAKRQTAIAAFATLRKTDLLKRSRTFFWSADKQSESVLHGVEAL